MTTAIKIPFGYNTLIIASITVYTGKIRVKTLNGKNFYDHAFPVPTCIEPGQRGTVILTFSTLDHQLFQEQIRYMKSFLYRIMHDRLIEKYHQEPVDVLL